ncbi:serine-rich adhesin for platelets-like [Erpetoichthys calabaricus]|uniref:serine-rich adhesin for platelets-like n=1 Tax=Erpetoichthys calabaricus TaxID=27687 RepID=UPI0022344D94|nr:serine-rich adhesin for platelets-like [Erpetoichthys calabaricus]
MLIAIEATALSSSFSKLPVANITLPGNTVTATVPNNLTSRLTLTTSTSSNLLTAVDTTMASAASGSATNMSSGNNASAITKNVVNSVPTINLSLLPTTISLTPITPSASILSSTGPVSTNLIDITTSTPLAKTVNPTLILPSTNFTSTSVINKTVSLSFTNMQTTVIPNTALPSTAFTSILPTTKEAIFSVNSSQTLLTTANAPPTNFTSLSDIFSFSPASVTNSTTATTNFSISKRVPTLSLLSTSSTLNSDVSPPAPKTTEFSLTNTAFISLNTRLTGTETIASSSSAARPPIVSTRTNNIPPNSAETASLTTTQSLSILTSTTLSDNTAEISTRTSNNTSLTTQSFLSDKPNILTGKTLITTTSNNLSSLSAGSFPVSLPSDTISSSAKSTFSVSNLSTSSSLANNMATATSPNNFALTSSSYHTASINTNSLAAVDTTMVPSTLGLATKASSGNNVPLITKTFVNSVATVNLPLLSTTVSVTPIISSTSLSSTAPPSTNITNLSINTPLATAVNTTMMLQSTNATSTSLINNTVTNIQTTVRPYTALPSTSSTSIASKETTSLSLDSSTLLTTVNIPTTDSSRSVSNVIFSLLTSPTSSRTATDNTISLQSLNNFDTSKKILTLSSLSSSSTLNSDADNGHSTPSATATANNLSSRSTNNFGTSKTILTLSALSSSSTHNSDVDVGPSAFSPKTTDSLQTNEAFISLNTVLTATETTALPPSSAITPVASTLSNNLLSPMTFPLKTTQLIGPLLTSTTSLNRSSVSAQSLSSDASTTSTRKTLLTTATFSLPSIITASTSLINNTVSLPFPTGQIRAMSTTATAPSISFGNSLQTSQQSITVSTLSSSFETTLYKPSFIPFRTASTDNTSKNMSSQSTYTPLTNSSTTTSTSVSSKPTEEDITVVPSRTSISTTSTETTKQDLGTVGNLSVMSITTTSIGLSWSLVRGIAISYRVEAKGITSINLTVNSEFAVITGLTPGNKYALRVIAVAADNITEGQAVTITAFTKPDIVKYLTVSSISGNSVFLKWIAPDGGVSRYLILQKESAEFGTALQTVTEPYANITSLLPLTTYTIQVKAVTEDGTLGDPVPVMVTTTGLSYRYQISVVTSGTLNEEIKSLILQMVNSNLQKELPPSSFSLSFKG